MIDARVDEGDIANFRVRLRNVQDQINDNLKDWVGGASEAAANIMRAEAPRHHGLLANSIRVQEPSYLAGGLGGGGSWVSRVDIDPFIAPHYRFVMEGTGIYGSNGRPYTSRGNGPMIFNHVGRTWFLYSVEGQRPQREWFDDGADIANDIIQQRARFSKPFRDF